MNNLAYTYLKRGDVDNARKVLAQVPKGAALHVELIATFGLLRLWEGKEGEGREWYERAESQAVAEGRKDVRRVKQKKHLELARFFIRQGELIKAAAEIREGLLMRDFPLSYRRQLEELRDNVKTATARP